MPLARRTVNSLCGLLQQLAGAKEIHTPILEYTAAAVLTMCAGLRAATHDAEIMAAAAGRRALRAEEGGFGGRLDEQKEAAMGPSSASALSTMSRDEAARIVRGLSQLLCRPLMRGQVDTGASCPARGQLACSLAHILSHLQATKPCDAGLPPPLDSDDHNLLGVDGIRDAGEALLGLGNHQFGSHTDDEGIAGAAHGEHKAIGAVLDEAVLAAARGHAAVSAASGRLAAQAMDGAVSALADVGDAVSVRLATDCLEAPAYVSSDSDRDPDELSPPLLRTRDVFLHTLGVVMSFGAAAGGAARWSTHLVHLGLPARLLESLRSLDALERKLRRRLGAATGQPDDHGDE